MLGPSLRMREKLEYPPGDQPARKLKNFVVHRILPLYVL